MALRRSRQTVEWGPGLSRSPTPEEIRRVLRAADELIGQGGRTLLAKILKGSREKRVLELGLDACPVYGAMKAQPVSEVMALIDHCLRAGYLSLTYSGRLPVLVFTERGWAIERATMVQELFNQWREWVEHGVVPASMEYLKDRNRGMIFEFLDTVQRQGDARYIPLLTRWAAVDYKKVRARIAEVMSDLERRP
jgi:superfamily II DNA helicase RecQ